MKNIAVFLSLFFTFTININAQISCSGASIISSGTHTVTDINVPGEVPFPECAENFGALRTSGRWFTFNATVDGVATVSSSIPSNSNTDTRLHIYSGDCSNLVCVAGNDDADAFGGIKTSETTFPISIGTNYYIAWDNQWTSSGFDFSLAEVAVSCPNGALPINEDFDNFNSFVACLTVEDSDGNGETWEQRFLDFDGDSIEEDFVTNGSNAINAKDDWIFSTPINLTSGNQYTVNFKYNGANGTFAANENLDVMILDQPISSANVLTTLHSETGITPNGTFPESEILAYTQSIPYTSTVSGIYYIAFNATSSANTGSLLLFDYSVTEEILNVDTFRNSIITKFYNPISDELIIKSSTTPLTKLEILNSLGQMVQENILQSTEASVKLSSLADSVYILKIYSINQIDTFKLLKN